MDLANGSLIVHTAIDKEERFLSVISYLLHTYAYLVIGMLLAVVNIPVSLIVMTRKALRDSYLVLAIVFLNSGFTGIAAISLGMKRLFDTLHGESLIDHHKCVLNVPTLLVTAFLVDGFSLLMNSMERFVVVAFPIYYYVHSRRISYLLIIAQYAITFVTIISTIVSSLIEPTRQISNFCLLQVVYASGFYKAILLLTNTASFFSVILMIVVVVILKKKFGAKFLSSHSYNRDLSNFLHVQKRYTQTVLISCCLTFFLVVVPTIVQYTYMMDSKSQIIVVIALYIPFLNSFNMIILFVWRQDDLRHAVLHCYKLLYHGGRSQIHAVTNDF